MRGQGVARRGIDYCPLVSSAASSGWRSSCSRSWIWHTPIQAPPLRGMVHAPVLP